MMQIVTVKGFLLAEKQKISKEGFSGEDFVVYEVKDDGDWKNQKVVIDSDAKVNKVIDGYIIKEEDIIAIIGKL